MARFDHLQLVRLPEQMERRKHGGGGPPPPREPGPHGTKLRAELETAVRVQVSRRRAEFIDPSLILRVQMTGNLLEEDWERLGLTVLSTNADRSLILFSSTDDMREFHERLDAYSRGTPAGQKYPSYNAFIGNIEAIGPVEPRDRIGVRFQEQGFTTLEDFAENASYLVDIELWDLGRRELRQRKLGHIVNYVETTAGEIVDQYIGPSITMLRVRVSGTIARALLSIEDVSSIDLPPEPDIETSAALELEFPDLPFLNSVDDRFPVIGIIDSGVNAHPLLEDILVGAIGVPATLGTADDVGHGTRISGVATFGDLREQIANNTLNRTARLCSAKVINNLGAFDDRRLVPSQMREAINRLKEEFGCRIFVLALCDIKSRYDGGKVGTWAATLDELARELDIVIVVSSGNRSPRTGTRLEQAVTEYPQYLLESSNRFFEPAGAMNVLTVGALSHGEGLDPDLADDVRVRPITRRDEPAPFSRIGPGIGGAIKPDLVDIGGTLVFDPVVARLRRGDDLPSAGVLTLHHAFLERLFTSGSGTSYAAPLLAFKAAHLLARFPNASANLIRALLANAAEIPEAARERLQSLGGEALRAICGHGRIDLERAAYSDEARVVLYADDELAVDHFAIYQIPIPELFQSEPGERSIQISLAFDPPVRHSRTDYAGIGMGFRLLRGCQPDLIFEHFRRRGNDEARFPKIENRYHCALLPGPQEREKGTLQSASITWKRSVEAYGDPYYLVVRCNGGWANHVAQQRFAVVVEIRHKAQIQLYERVRQQVRVTV